MTTIGLLLLCGSSVGGLLYWASVLRPHLKQRGITQITAPNWGMSALSDWQMCSDHARKNHDLESRRIARGFALFLGGQVVGLLFVGVGIGMNHP